MTTTQAIIMALSEPLYQVLKGRGTANPELLKLASLEAFKQDMTGNVPQQLRRALLVLDDSGMFHE